MGPKDDGSSSMGGARGHFIFDLGGLVMYKMVQGSPWGDALQQADSGAAIESFWRCSVFDMAVFVVRSISGVMYLP